MINKNISFEIVPNIEFQLLSELMEEFSLYESSYDGSRFLTLIDELAQGKTYPMSGFTHQYFDINEISAVFAYDNNSHEIVGLCILEHLTPAPKTKHNKIIKSFTKNKKKYYFKVLGIIGLYVKDDYRNMGIASELSCIIESHIVVNNVIEDNEVIIIGSKDKATPFLKYFSNLINRSNSILCYTAKQPIYPRSLSEGFGDELLAHHLKGASSQAS
jgi:ribosomal protein S18 acetylase RimI-like enzyme